MKIENLDPGYYVSITETKLYSWQSMADPQRAAVSDMNNELANSEYNQLIESVETDLYDSVLGYGFTTSDGNWISKTVFLDNYENYYIVVIGTYTDNNLVWMDRVLDTLKFFD